VAAATKVGDYPAKIDLSTETRIRGRFLAIDRLSFPTVGWFRYDFTEETLGGLMNRLAASPDSILVSQQFLVQHSLGIGDKIAINVTINDVLIAVSPFTIAGIYTYFPTVYEEDDVTIIGNLDYFSYLFGLTVPHRVWLNLHDNVAGESIFRLMAQKMGFQVTRPMDSRALIDEEQARLERVGIFGTLSIGFLASVIMAGLGLLLNSYASLQERLYRFAVLHAVGVRRQQLIGQVILEYSFLLAYGAAAGAFAGLLASELFVPFFRVTGEQGLPLPPLLPLIERRAIWNLTASFALTIILVEIALISLVLYQRLAALLKVHWG
jgi:predicted lysophospholipase L1 biosynthesis ABC-type transport system permease subunit